MTTKPLPIEIAARTVFCSRCDIAPEDLDACLEDNAYLAAEFDATMDEVAADPLTDAEIDFDVPNVFFHMDEIGLVNPRPIRLLTRGYAVRIFNHDRPSSVGRIS